MKQLSLVVAAVALAACAEPLSTPPQAEADPSPVVAASTTDVIPGQYIVVLRQRVNSRLVSSNMVSGVNGTLRHVYTAALRGFAANLSDAAVAALRANPDVEYVEPDQVYSIVSVQPGATWGIDRIDQRALPLSGTYSYTNTGRGVTAYIIDTGIRFDHTEFGGRATTGFDAVTAGGSAADCNGHGTHVSGTVGGSTYGVAKEVSLVAVRVLDCGGSGSTSGVVAGIDWVTAHHNDTPGPDVANMSLGGGASTALDNAVRNSIAAGVTYGIAAGNGNFIGIAQDACRSSPARVGEAITVGAANSTDKKASWSNYGNCVDFFGPGVSITSSWYTSSTATNTISGTSMATPHVVGVAALYKAAFGDASSSTIRSWLINNSTASVITGNPSGTPNRLLYKSTL